MFPFEAEEFESESDELGGDEEEEEVELWFSVHFGRLEEMHLQQCEGSKLLLKKQLSKHFWDFDSDSVKEFTSGYGLKGEEEEEDWYKER